MKAMSEMLDVEPNATVPGWCSRCNTPVTIPRSIVDMARRMHESLLRRGDRGAPPTLRDLVECDACAPIAREERRVQTETRNAREQVHWVRLRQAARACKEGGSWQTFLAAIDSMPPEMRRDDRHEIEGLKAWVEAHRTTAPARSKPNLRLGD